MGDEIVSFLSEEFGRVRTAYQDGQGWFIAKDVCKALEIKNVSDAVERLDADEKGIVTNYTHGGEQKLLVVNEFGLYSLTLTSRKPSAKKFKRWITHVVLPKLRQMAMWKEIRQDGKVTRRSLTDTIKKFLEYLKERGELDRLPVAWYSAFSNLVNKTVGVEKNNRDNLKALQILRLQDAEDKIAAAIEDGMSTGKTHHDIWVDCNKVLNVE